MNEQIIETLEKCSEYIKEVSDLSFGLEIEDAKDDYTDYDLLDEVECLIESLRNERANN